MIHRLGIILALLVLMLAASGRASAAALSFRADTPSDCGTASVDETRIGPLLWTFLNPWASPLSGSAVNADGYQGLLALAEDGGLGSTGAESAGDDGSQPGLSDLVNFSMLFLAGVTGLSHGTQTTTSSGGAPSGPSPDGGLPVKLERSCAEAVALLALEDNLLYRRDYALGLFRPPRAL